MYLDPVFSPPPALPQVSLTSTGDEREEPGLFPVLIFLLSLPLPSHGQSGFLTANRNVDTSLPRDSAQDLESREDFPGGKGTGESCG